MSRGEAPNLHAFRSRSGPTRMRSWGFRAIIFG
jgi:hypothetical protein